MLGLMTNYENDFGLTTKFKAMMARHDVKRAGQDLDAAGGFNIRKDASRFREDTRGWSLVRVGAGKNVDARLVIEFNTPPELNADGKVSDAGGGYYDKLRYETSKEIAADLTEKLGLPEGVITPSGSALAMFGVDNIKAFRDAVEELGDAGLSRDLQKTFATNVMEKREALLQKKSKPAAGAKAGLN